MLKIRRQDESMYNNIDEEGDPGDNNASSHLESPLYSFFTATLLTRPEQRKTWGIGECK